MLKNILGAALGRRLTAGQSGARGLLIGALAPAIVRRAFGPLGLVIGGAYVAKRLWDRHQANERAGEAIEPSSVAAGDLGPAPDSMKPTARP